MLICYPEHPITSVSALNKGSNTDLINIDASPLNEGQQGQNRNVLSQLQANREELLQDNKPSDTRASSVS